LTKENKNTHPLVARVVRLRIAVLLFVALSIFGGVYFYSSESKQPFIGQPKALNQALLEQEIENAALLFRLDSIVKVNETLTVNQEPEKGILFEVQVSSEESFELDIQHENLQPLNVAIINGVNYITLGKFKDVDDARLFIEDLKKIGISDAFIVSKLDGKVVSANK
jgi:hypothetical protein